MISDSVIQTQTITIYIRYVSEIADSPFPSSGGAVRYDRVVVRGCQWEEDIQVNPDSSGISTPSRTISVIIPADADTGGKIYIKPHKFAALPLDNFDYWTIRPGAANPDIIALGEAPELTALYTINDVIREYKTTSPVQVSDTMDGDILPHLEITGV